MTYVALVMRLVCGDVCRIANEKRQAVVSALQAVCPTKSLVVTLRQPVPIVKAQLKRKRSSSKALEAARNS